MLNLAAFLNQLVIVNTRHLIRSFENPQTNWRLPNLDLKVAKGVDPPGTLQPFLTLLALTLPADYH